MNIHNIHQKSMKKINFTKENIQCLLVNYDIFATHKDSKRIGFKIALFLTR